MKIKTLVLCLLTGMTLGQIAFMSGWSDMSHVFGSIKDTTNKIGLVKHAFTSKSMAEEYMEKGVTLADAKQYVERHKHDGWNSEYGVMENIVELHERGSLGYKINWAYALVENYRGY